MNAQQQTIIPLSRLLVRRARLSVGIRRVVIGGQFVTKTTVMMPRG
jgi:hypothetical protein